MWLLAVPKCSKCRFPLQPTGQCAKCGAREAEHSMTWAQYYREAQLAKRFNEQTSFDKWVPLLTVIFVLILVAWFIAAA